ncbi:MAG: hypothetical protein H6Q62_322, partial [Firmicutes bacterium]|nr:hypothetical protein [Bacillota bacterium]
ERNNMPQNFENIGQDLNLRGRPARITLFVGAYGSGKSEVSVNYALWLARHVRTSDQRVVLCDLDTINPYYRSADAKTVLAENQIELIASIYVNTNVDVPAVPAGIFSVFDDESILAVLDIGGEDLGARVVGSLRERLAGQDFAINLVVNPFRLTTNTPEGIAWTADSLTSTIGLHLTGLVDNANLLDEQNLSQLIESFPVVAEGARLVGLPVCFATTMAEIPSRQNLLDLLRQTDQLPTSEALANLPMLRLIRSIHYPTDPFANPE